MRSLSPASYPPPKPTKLPPRSSRMTVARGVVVVPGALGRAGRQLRLDCRDERPDGRRLLGRERALPVAPLEQLDGLAERGRGSVVFFHGVVSLVGDS
jgi:hypothetical protein